MSNKKGFSLVEVVVALGILVAVFSITVILIIQTLNIAINTRKTTQGLLLAQKELNEEIIKIERGCQLPADEEAPNNSGYTVRISHEEGPTINQVEESNLVKITVDVEWIARGTFSQENHKISLSRVVGR